MNVNIIVGNTNLKKKKKDFKSNENENIVYNIDLSFDRRFWLV